MKYAILTCEHWDNARIFAAPTEEEAMAKAEAFVRAAWAEWNEPDEAALEAYMSGEDGDFPWMWMPANMDG